MSPDNRPNHTNQMYTNLKYPRLLRWSWSLHWFHLVEIGSSLLDCWLVLSFLHNNPRRLVDCSNLSCPFGRTLWSIQCTAQRGWPIVSFFQGTLTDTPFLVWPSSNYWPVGSLQGLRWGTLALQFPCQTALQPWGCPSSFPSVRRT